MKKVISIVWVLVIIGILGISAAPALAADGQAGKRVKVGLAQIHYTNDFRVAMTDQMIKLMEENDMDFVWNEAKKDTATQIANVNDLLVQGIDYLVLAPNEADGVVTALEACKAANVPVIIVDRSVNAKAGEDYVTYIGTDQKENGQITATWMAEHFKDKELNIAFIVGNAGSSNAYLATEGWKSVISQHKNMTVLAEQYTDYSRAQGQEVTENLMQAYGDKLNVIMVESEELTAGVLQGLRSAGYTPGKDVNIIAAGTGNREQLESIVAGDVLACREVTPLLAPQVIEVIKAMEAGKKDFPPFIPAANRFFLADTAKKALDEGSAW